MFAWKNNASVFVVFVMRSWLILCYLFLCSCNRLSSSSLLHFANVLTSWPTKLRAISVCENPLVEPTIARECLEKVFNVVSIEDSIESAMVYADYISEM